MPWTAPYQADYTKLLIRQLLSIVQRDQRSALDFVGGAGVLPDIVSYQLAPLTRPIFPAVLIYPVGEEFDQAAWRAAKGVIELLCNIAVTNPDNQTLIEQAQDYVRALDLIFNVLPTTNFTDLYTSRPVTIEFLGVVTAPALAVGTVKELFVASHRYDMVAANMTEFSVMGSLRLRIDRIET